MEKKKLSYNVLMFPSAIFGGVMAYLYTDELFDVSGLTFILATAGVWFGGYVLGCAVLGFLAGAAGFEFVDKEKKES